MKARTRSAGNGSLNVVRYGHILKPRQLVGVRGAGLAYDGLYYVDSVTHNIKRGEYKQNFTLSRDGLISQTPVVGCHERDRTEQDVLRQVPRHGAQQRRP